MKTDTPTVEIQLLAAKNRTVPIPFTLRSTELLGLLSESIELAKLISTQERDLAAIRADYTLRVQYLENLHMETLLFLESAYKERPQIIAAINENAKLLIAAGEYTAAQQIMLRMTDFISQNSPLKTALELRNRNQ